ncbi:MAG TPA: winged helix-turn-helix domain-containing protein, partial [Candidatus Angelobacter sp.]|nr:winged helix-turn-helix domain-containing protein [Candidatus Angelobacter sp.]
MSAGMFQFGEYHLDSSRFELLRKGRSVRLERKPMELLILLASKKGELVSREEITEHLWGREVFVDAERGINTAVRKVRYVLRDDPERPRFIQTVTGKGYRFSGVVEEVSQKVSAPELGNGRHSETDPSKDTADEPALPDPKGPDHGDNIWQTAGRRFSRRLAVAGMSFVLVAVILLVGVRESSSHSANRAALSRIHSLAVLPLNNNSGDPAQNYFTDGMTDELTTMLAKRSTLRIAPQSSAMQYKGADKSTRDIAQALRVDGVIVGSVDRSGGKVHLRLQLVNETAKGSNDNLVWSESYVRDANDAVLLPGEVATTIAMKTNSVAAGPAPERNINPEAHDAYLHGRYLWVAGRNNEAGTYFLKAAALQPDYALAWSGVADYYGMGLVTGAMDP